MFEFCASAVVHQGFGKEPDLKNKILEIITKFAKIIMPKDFTSSTAFAPIPSLENLC